MYLLQFIEKPEANGDGPTVIFAAGSSIRATDLNANQENFIRYGIQESNEIAEQIDTGAITSSKIVDGTIVDADINASQI